MLSCVSLVVLDYFFGVLEMMGGAPWSNSGETTVSCAHDIEGTWTNPVIKKEKNK
jgi:hypothetical protein